MRCPECNKFVSFDEPQVEVQDAEIDGNSVRGNVRIVLPCGECSQELKDAELEFEMDFEHECEGKRKEKGDNDFELDGDVDASPTDRFQDKDRHGKPIKNFRYQRHYYGADLTVQVKCNRCQQTFEVTGKVEEQASGFNELV